MTIEKRPNATADKNAPTQAPSQAPILTPGKTVARVLT